MTAAPDPHPSRSPLPEPVTEAGRAGLRAVLDQPSAAVVALDFDGTLADIVPDPDSARARPGAVDALARLAPHVRSIAVVTGRPAETAVRYGGFAHVPGLEHLVVLGLYGAERWDAASGELTAPPPPPGLTAARAELPAVLAGHGNLPGLWTEDKGQAVAVHTRRAEDPQGAYDALLAPLTALAARHGLIVEPGRMVLELRPPGMDKGKALTTYLDEVGAASVLYAGDDLGDLAAYAAVEAGRPARPGLLLASGTEVPELTVRADLPLAGGPEEVVAFLSTLADTLS
ncbi:MULTISPECIES: trehalose-phosphatase [Streptomyces]|uniref:trehalose-phosphatase n=1 Tax=Streptomyces TaxID=1883 RepID=UPI0023B9CADB|nr:MULTISPECIES: trehalose-phosphatase [unclassified Streptomyces]MDT0424520.1 trehalose-phosphatase [Streptomyces sp. DSM 41859]WEH28203.1 trehalose-phosphatase [Streptomyces sp. AM 3-1-1]